MYTAIFTPYVAAFLLGEPEYNQKKSNYRYINTDPIVIIDLIGKWVALMDECGPAATYRIFNVQRLDNKE